MNTGIMLMAGLLLGLLLIGLLLGLQIWLASKKATLPGLVQPIIWGLLALVGNLLPRLSGTAVEGGLAAGGAIVMAVLSLAAWWIARRRLR